MCASSHCKEEEEERCGIYTEIPPLGDVILTYSALPENCIVHVRQQQLQAKRKRRRDMEYTDITPLGDVILTLHRFT